jgi:hypothetical protein
MDSDACASNANANAVLPEIDFTSAGFDHHDPDMFFHPQDALQTSFGSQVGLEEEEDDEDEDSTGLKGEDDEGDDTDVQTLKKT